jgi:hypothetical protein
MNKHLYASISGLTLLCLASVGASAAPGESISLDPKTSDYTIIYMTDGQLQQAIFVPSTKIVPTFKSRFELGRNWQIHYRYTVKSGKASKQYLDLIILDPVSSIVADPALNVSPTSSDANAIFRSIKAGMAAVSSPANWDGDATPHLAANATGSANTSVLRIGWSSNRYDMGLRNGIPPGGTASGFGFDSVGLPGIGTVQLEGRAPSLSFEDEGPDGEIGDQFDQLWTHNYVERFAAVPTIIIPTPYDQAEALRRIESHVRTWIDLKLLDPVLYTQMDRFFQAAIDDAGRNNARGCIAAIDSIRKLLKKEHERLDDGDEDGDDAKPNGRQPLIARLAAQVLDFDLRYVRRRLGFGDDHAVVGAASN